MEYSIKCYFDPSNGKNYDKLVYLGRSILADEYTYTHYLSLLNGRVPFIVAFDSIDFGTMQVTYHQFTVSHGRIVFADAEFSNTERALILITPNRVDHSYLSKEDYNDEKKMTELLEKLARQDLRKYFNR